MNNENEPEKETNEVKFIDIHTHSLSHDPTVIEIEVIDMELFSLFPTQPSGKFCAGFHPWSVQDIDEESFIQKLAGLRPQMDFFALGEIGLDKVRDQH